MISFAGCLLGLTSLAFLLNLQGCGDSEKHQTTGTTTTTTRVTTTRGTTTTVSQVLPLPSPNHPCPESMQSRLLERAQYWVKNRNLSIALAYAGPDGSGNTCSMGRVVHARKVSRPALTENFVFGSLTKMWTSSAVLKLHQEGHLHIDEPAFPYMELAYLFATGRSLTEKFDKHLISSVTIRELLSMRGNIDDYDEFNYQLANPHDDLDPARTVEKFGKSISGPPLGSCGSYSSMSYVLLGLVLIGKNMTAWDKYDQNVWREFFPEIHFATHGTCSNYVDFPEAKCYDRTDVNVMDMSCTNGFACGNLVSTPEQVARFVWYIFEGKLLNPSTMQEMLTFQKLGIGGPDCHVGFCTGCGYGLGVEEHAHGLPFPGHAGDTYGFFTINAYVHDRRATYVAGISSNSEHDDPSGIWWDLYNLDLFHDHVVV